MPDAAGITYAALKPLSLSRGGERLRLAPGGLVPAEWHGRWLESAVNCGKVAALAGSLAACSDEELKAETQRRGYKLTRARSADKALA